MVHPNPPRGISITVSPPQRTSSGQELRQQPALPAREREGTAVEVVGYGTVGDAQAEDGARGRSLNPYEPEGL